MRRVLRLVVFILGVLVLRGLLVHVPGIGPFFQRSGLIGIWVAAILLSWLVTRYGRWALSNRRLASKLRALGAVDTPNNQGKLGALYLAHGRAKRALEPLRKATEGEPQSAEWWYRRGCAQLASGAAEEAVESLRRSVAIDEEHAYGASQLRLAEAHRKLGQADQALAALAVFERNHGPSPESAYRRGVVLKESGRKDEAHRALSEVSELARRAARYQQREANLWALKARLTSWF